MLNISIQHFSSRYNNINNCTWLSRFNISTITLVGPKHPYPRARFQAYSLHTRGILVLHAYTGIQFGFEMSGSFLHFMSAVGFKRPLLFPILLPFWTAQGFCVLLSGPADSAVKVFFLRFREKRLKTCEQRGPQHFTYGGTPLFLA